MQINEWLIEEFGANIRGAEANFPCPKCGHKSFYFNIIKKVGICFRAGCVWKPNLQELRNYIQEHGILLEDITNWHDNPKTIIELPEGSKPIISSITSDNIIYNDKQALSYLLNRKITPLKIFLYKIHSNLERVILPVYDNGVLISYVARQIRGEDTGYRYLYPKSGRHSDTILNWLECKQWKQITLVENSFVSLALRELFVSTNFGSHLSDEQIGKLMSSNIKSVVLLWDENSEPKAEAAVLKLRRLGLPACYVRIKGQPDNYESDIIKKFISEGHAAALSNVYKLNMRNA